MELTDVRSRIAHIEMADSGSFSRNGGFSLYSSDDRSWNRQNVLKSSSSLGRAAFGGVGIVSYCECNEKSCDSCSASSATANAVRSDLLASDLLLGSIASSLGLDGIVFLSPCFSA
ncbi:unnamed protein product [Microthlaspi erraticum]|uniref:Uncharacterized protein n=1 Tax=Microthlaspi erraticum TaxID=1685480 RepID=A0A6D2HRG9_9BRAS|nr:unnamed protein product [Microthlaspi erraticum]